MQTEFTYPPEHYLQESQNASRFWYLWMPILSIPLTLIIAVHFPVFFGKWMASESTGFLEFIHFLFPALTSLVALRILFFEWIRKNPITLFWSTTICIGGFYLSGEEASWMQHYLGWTTPEFWQGVNDQGETNLHNTSGLLDQLPRLVLWVGISVTGLIFPWLLINRPNVLPRSMDFTYPALALRPLAACVLAGWMYGQLEDISPPEWTFMHSIRSGEFHETYIVWFLLAYTIFLYRRARRYAHRGE